MRESEGDYLFWVGREEDSPVSVPNNDLTPARQACPWVQARILPDLFKPELFLQEARKIAGLRVTSKILGGLIGDFDANRHLVGQVAQLFSAIAESVEDVIERVALWSGGQYAGGHQRNVGQILLQTLELLKPLHAYDGSNRLVIPQDDLLTASFRLPDVSTLAIDIPQFLGRIRGRNANQVNSRVGCGNGCRELLFGCRNLMRG